AEFYGWSVDTLRSMYIWQINMLDEGAIRSEMTNASQQRRSYFVFRHRLTTGDIRDVEVHSGPIVTGGRTLLYSIIHDITERKRAAQQIAAANAQRKAVLDAATRVSIIATDASGVITVFNSGAERMLGYAASDVIGARNITELHLDTELVQHARRLAFE